MKKTIKTIISVFLLSLFLAACAEGESPDEPIGPDVPGDAPGNEIDPGTEDEGM